MVIVLPDGTTLPLIDIVYNPTTNEYEVTTYNVENNEYNNYTYKYYLQYTYVTYIGETSDFEAYKCYYQLPDGRNSADLTPEELEQLSVAIDVVEYSRATDDVRVRALYHFDGNTKDSSYWNHQSKFDWSNTPSITYMDVETFNGALYLDGSVRSTLNMSLPTELGRGDFTIQFRYYQGQKIADDDYTGLYLNADFLEDEWSPRTDDEAYQILNFNGSAIGSSALGIIKTENYPVGSWFEVCITRQGNVLTYYLNGMPVHHETISSMAFDKTLTFHFDGGTVAYAMIDELRVLNYAIVSGDGSYYEPTAVPHDTNLALVLPEDKVAIADEYWEITSSGNNLLKSRGLDDWTTQWIDTSKALVPVNYKVGNTNGTWNFTLDPANLISDGLIAYYNTDVIDLDFNSSGTMFDLVYDKPQHYEYLSLAGGFMSLPSGYSVPFSSIYIPISIGGNSVLADDSYVFSVVNGSGVIRTIKFTIKDGLVQTGTSASFGNMRISASRIGSGSTIVSYICIGFNPKTDKVPTQPIVYMELLQGATSTDLKAEFHEDVAILDKDDQFKPTLAVRTDLEITDYQIGGVRPAIPKKGLVYALVQSGYITSLQIYNGQAWEGVDGRIWTGERWIPYSSYNIITLQDMYDISDTTNDYEYIYTETGFWSWWQRSWNEFTGKLFGLLGGGAGDVDLDEPVTESDPENEDDLSFWEFIKLLLNGCKAVFTGTRQLFSGVVSTVPEAVSTLTGAFEPGGVAVGFLDGTDPDADAAELRIVSYTIPSGTYNRGDPLDFSIEATGIGLTYEWYHSTSASFGKVSTTRKSFSRTASAVNGTIQRYFVKCVVTDYMGNQVSTGTHSYSVDATSSSYSLRGFRDVDINEYYETEVLDPWRYR
ncbi:MAG: hypothetical protein IKU20_08875 [Lachnospiraceae bacterium]|nr:hypothetical protein [Lachnospiraceae bacterium]